jgi:hypothetical protein
VTAKELVEKHVQVSSTPQGTADVSLDGVYIRAFSGGPIATISANHLKDQLVMVIQAILEEWDGRVGPVGVPVGHESVAVAPIQTEPMEVTVGDVGSVEEVMCDSPKEKKHWYSSN